MLLNAKFSYLLSMHKINKNSKEEYKAICSEIKEAIKEGKFSILHRGELNPIVKKNLERKGYKIRSNKSTYVYEVYWGK